MAVRRQDDELKTPKRRIAAGRENCGKMSAFDPLQPFALEQPHILGFLSIFWRTPITFSNYIKQLVRIGLSSSLALGIIIGLSLLVGGGMTAEIDLTLEFGAFDGIWFLIGLPILTILVSLIMSPLSFGIHRLPSIRSKNIPQGDE